MFNIFKRNKTKLSENHCHTCCKLLGNETIAVNFKEGKAVLHHHRCVQKKVGNNVKPN